MHSGIYYIAFNVFTNLSLYDLLCGFPKVFARLRGLEFLKPLFPPFLEIGALSVLFQQFPSSPKFSRDNMKRLSIYINVFSSLP